VDPRDGETPGQRGRPLPARQGASQRPGERREGEQRREHDPTSPRAQGEFVDVRPRRPGDPRDRRAGLRGTLPDAPEALHPRVVVGRADGASVDHRREHGARVAPHRRVPGDGHAEEHGEGGREVAGIEVRIAPVAAHAGTCEAGDHPGDVGSGSAVAAFFAVAVVGGDDREVAGEVEAVEGAG
jgi:hypothetical protein